MLQDEEEDSGRAADPGEEDSLTSHPPLQKKRIASGLTRSTGKSCRPRQMSDEEVQVVNGSALSYSEEGDQRRRRGHPVGCFPSKLIKRRHATVVERRSAKRGSREMLWVAKEKNMCALESG